jgi:hypothetical protein
MHRVFDHPSKGFLGPCVDPLTYSGVCSVRDGKVMPMLPAVVTAKLQSKRQYLTWFFPADA